jgi:hypothetical protein
MARFFYENFSKENKVNKKGIVFGGIPTDIDIRALREAFPTSAFTVGMTISYDAVEKVIDCASTSHRWKTVTTRWRKLVEKDTGIIIGVKSGTFVVLDDHEKLDLSYSKMRTSFRATRRSVHVVSLTDRKALTEEEQKQYDVLTSRQRAMMAAAQLKGKAELPNMIKK